MRVQRFFCYFYRVKLRQYYLYILTNTYSRVLYIGVTNDLLRRLDEHHTSSKRSFAYRYNLKKLLYFEAWDTAEQAIAREKQLKRWHREWKLNLIREFNPKFKDLTDLLY